MIWITLEFYFKVHIPVRLVSAYLMLVTVLFVCWFIFDSVYGFVMQNDHNKYTVNRVIALFLNPLWISLIILNSFTKQNYIQVLKKNILN
jgi:hypothetical protein